MENEAVSVAEIESLKVDHPEFCMVMAGGVGGFPVAVFERQQWFKPTPEQIVDYRRREKIVEENGGYMVQSWWEIAGETPRFTKDECAAMVKAVETSLPDFVVRDTWNGVNCRSFSVSIKPRN